MSAEPSCYIHDFHKVRPPHSLSQGELTAWIARRHARAEELRPVAEANSAPEAAALFHRYAVKENQIARRFFECGDIFKNSFADCEVFQLTPWQRAGIDIYDKALFFNDKARRVFDEIYPFEQRPQLARPDHLIHVTCTGYVSPSPAQRKLADRRWEKVTGLTHAYHMGCYASLPAVRLARGLWRQEVSENPSFRVDIVHTEMCGLHMNPLAHTPEQIVVQSLFADGHMKYSLSGRAAEGKPAFHLRGVLERILPGTEEDMTWIPSPHGMMMTLSREVPLRLKKVLDPFVHELTQKHSLSPARLEESLFAVHPGGPKIIEAARRELGLREDQVRHSRQVLRERGNMSSATLPHVWNEILRENPPSGTPVISLAFGPGLTLFGALFEVA